MLTMIVDDEALILEEMSDFIEIQARRAARHRGMLEIEWIEIIDISVFKSLNLKSRKNYF